MPPAPAGRYRRRAWSNATSGSSSRPSATGSAACSACRADGYRSRLTDYLNALRADVPRADRRRGEPLDGDGRGRATAVHRAVAAPHRARDAGRRGRPTRADLTPDGAGLNRPSRPRLRLIGHGQSITQMSWKGLSRSEMLRASPRMFESDLLDKLSRVHPAVPPILFGPAIVVPARRGVRPGRRLADAGVAARRLPVLDADGVLAAPDRVPLRAREGHRRPAALDHPRGPPRPSRTTRCAW